ncbi:MAG: methyl-accepting chemotaxis protein [Anaerofustis sp.]
MKQKKNANFMKAASVSLKAKMVLALSGIILICGIGLILFSYLYAQKSLQNAIGDSLMKLSAETADRMDQFVETSFAELNILASNPAVQSLQPDMTQLQQLMNNSASVSNSTSVFLLDKNGTIICASTGMSGSLADREYYQKAVQGNEFISDPIVSKEDGSIIFVAAVPVKNASGAIVGVLGAVKDASVLSEELSAVTYGETGYAFMIDDAGTFIAHPVMDKVLSSENVMTSNDPKQSELIALMQKMVSGENGDGQYTYEGVTKFMGYASLKNADWSVAITAPKDEVFASVYALRNILIMIGVFAVILGIGVSYFVAASVVNPVTEAAGYALTMAEGDFTSEISEKLIKRKDEIGSLGKAFLKMSKSLNETLSNIRTAAEQVSAGAHQVSDSSISLSQGATEQASSIEELSASIEEIAAQTKQNANNAKQADELAIQTKQNADGGSTQMQGMLGAMDAINVSSNNIFKIIKVIEDIAFQTNILALNAAVEAARAGQHGKGFAVVAEEVRNLAARSSQAAQETTDMIQDSITKVEEGSKIAQTTAAALNEIVEQIDRVAALVEDIANASNEQSIGIGQINEGIMQISAVVESNSAVAEESAASSEELAGQAQLLNEQVEHFRLRGNNAGNVHGSGRSIQMDGQMSAQDDSKY